MLRQVGPCFGRIPLNVYDLNICIIYAYVKNSHNEGRGDIVPDEHNLQLNWGLYANLAYLSGYR